jgi:uncharacterized protein YecE (DUF72 family)
LEAGERLAYYTRRFDTVEVNVTFYRLPFTGMVAGWNRRLPRRFHLVVKGPRVVTHLRKLVDCRQELDRFFERVGALRTLKVVLWQLPPGLARDEERLAAFLEQLPHRVRHAVEFRHPSWWSDAVVEVLARYRAAFVAVSHPRLPSDVVPTTDFLYLRFHGLGSQLYRYEYSPTELEAWAERVRPLLAGRRLYAFFNNDWGAAAPRNAEQFRLLFEEREVRRSRRRA